MTELQIREVLLGDYEQVRSLLQDAQRAHVEADPFAVASQERFLEDEVVR